MADDAHPARSAAPDLASALVESSQAAALLLDQDLIVLGASISFLQTFRFEQAAVVGKPAFKLGAGEWNVPQLCSLLQTTASGAASIDAYEIDLSRQGGPKRRLVLNARKLDYGPEGAPVRILLTVTDVTAARGIEKLKDDLLRDKAIALQEVQHRVANSLQIIASVILQSARKVQTEETRSYLKDAHNRVMSVAALQKQLAVSRIGQVQLRPYFIQLCESIGASMIRDHAQINLAVDVDDSQVEAEISVSLGLIVTELVINALKHAFLERQTGKIIVAYRRDMGGWTLCVRDDGMGMPPDPQGGKVGLGTTIVQALARQLKSRVEVVEAEPGTKISVIRDRAYDAAEGWVAEPAV